MYNIYFIYDNSKESDFLKIYKLLTLESETVWLQHKYI